MKFFRCVFLAAFILIGDSWVGETVKSTQALGQLSSPANENTAEVNTDEYGEQDWISQRTKWHDYEQLHFKIGDRSAYMVLPKSAAAGNPWIWRARFPGYHDEMDRQLVSQGFHLGYVDVAGLYGSPQAIQIGDEFYRFATSHFKVTTRPALEGVSRGGLFVYNWAAANPEKVACIYCDTPVCDFKSWPGGKGKGQGSEPDWQKCLKAYNLNEESAATFLGNPIDHAASIAKARIPLLHIVTENDQIVPPLENTYRLRDAIKEHGHVMKIISIPSGTPESKGHHFQHTDPQSIVDFIVQHTTDSQENKTQLVDYATRMQLLGNAKRIVFLGDSITYAGSYVAEFDAWLAEQKMPEPPMVINVGLPSETVSGLSEEGHAGGKFPRPDLAERLDRVLEQTKPDLVFACYGINCGIYLPADNQRLNAYQSGIRNLKRKVEAAGAKLILITPPTYDDERSKMDFSYNAVLDQYSQWLVSQATADGTVIDLHSAMNIELQDRRRARPEFTFQPDAVHPDAEGHHFIASQLIGWFTGDKKVALDSEEISKARKKMEILRDAYLTATGHKRPGIRAGLPLPQAHAEANKIQESAAK